MYKFKLMALATTLVIGIVLYAQSGANQSTCRTEGTTSREGTTSHEGIKSENVTKVSPSKKVSPSTMEESPSMFIPIDPGNDSEITVRFSYTYDEKNKQSESEEQQFAQTAKDFYDLLEMCKNADPNDKEENLKIAAILGEPFASIKEISQTDKNINGDLNIQIKENSILCELSLKRQDGYDKNTWGQIATIIKEFFEDKNFTEKMASIFQNAIKKQSSNTSGELNVSCK